MFKNAWIIIYHSEMLKHFSEYLKRQIMNPSIYQTRDPYKEVVSLLKEIGHKSSTHKSQEGPVSLHHCERSSAGTAPWSSVVSDTAQVKSSCAQEIWPGLHVQAETGKIKIIKGSDGVLRGHM